MRLLTCALLASIARADTEQITLNHSANQSFGTAIAVCGNSAAVSGRHNNRHQVWVYLNLATSSNYGPIIGQFIISHGFGEALAINNDWLVVGAPFYNQPFNNAGGVFLYDRQNGYVQQALVPSDPGPEALFGSSVAVLGDLVLVGAPGDDEWGFNAGAAYLFDANTGQQLAKLTHAEPASHLMVGFSVALSANWALVGAPLDESVGGGAVYVYDHAGQRITTLYADDPNPIPNMGFGRTLTVDGEFLLAGSKGVSGNTPPAVHLFSLVDGKEKARLFSGTGAFSDGFGDGIALSSELIAVAAASAESGPSGRVYLYDRRTFEQVMVWQSVAGQSSFGKALAGSGLSGHVVCGAQVARIPGALNSIGTTYCNSTTNSTGEEANLKAFGDRQPHLDDLLIAGADFPAGNFAMMIASQSQGFAQPPGSQGNICVGGLIVRYTNQVKMISDTGTVNFDVDLDLIPPPYNGPVLPGHTWNFQVWFRDFNPQLTSNFSDAVAVTFQ